MARKKEVENLDELVGKELVAPTLDEEDPYIDEAMPIKVEVFRYVKDAKIPVKADVGSSGFDLYAVLDTPITITQGDVALIPTGLNLCIPMGYEAQIRPRSGLALNKGLTVLNTPGTVDSSYCGEGEKFEVKVIIINHSKSAQTISPGERIAQMVFCKLPDVELVEVEDTYDWAPVTRTGGFGSTGV